MNLESFVHSLHADSGESIPPDWETDWEDAPLKYKLYRGLPAIPLSAEVPLSLDRQESSPSVKPDLAEIGHFLWYVYGLNQVSHLTDYYMGPIQMLRRFVPSGGGLYPSELYVYLKVEGAPAGVYHYDVAHHRLVLLREGDFDAYLVRALGNRCDLSACFGVVFVSTFFWKNFFKYNNFAYRLQGLDAGVLIGQLLEVANRFGFTAGVNFQFLDRAVNHLIGLSGQEESVYAVFPLSSERDADWFDDCKEDRRGISISAAELCLELPAVRHERYERSQTILEYPMLIQMNEASMLESEASFRQTGCVKSSDSGIRTVYLPRVKRPSYDLASVCRNRCSPESEFVMDKVTEAQLAALLQEIAASFSYRNDLDEPNEKSDPHVSLYACLHQVEGIPDGAYRYDIATHSLRLIQPGDHRFQLQQGMLLDNVSLFQVPICLHVAGDNRFLIPQFGYRGYRILQMEAGMLVQRLLLAATAIGMGGRPLLGIKAGNCDEIYKLAAQGKTTLIQLPIGFYRPRSILEGGLHS